jgi:hypothetical protein
MRPLHVLSCFLSDSHVQCSLAWISLFGVPMVFYGGYPKSPPGGYIQALRNAWESLLHTSIFLVAAVTLLAAAAIVFFTPSDESILNSLGGKKSKNRQRVWKLFMTPTRMSLCIVLLFLQLASLASYQQVVSPGWLWNPFLILLRYRVYWPSELAPALNEVCLDYTAEQATFREPLCLSESSWGTLSSGALSSANKEDVEYVLKGLSYLQTVSGGLVISVMGRDVDEHIEPLRLNVQSLLPFIPNLMVVVFENDSIDGSRQHFIRWQLDANKGYEIDLIECPEAKNCIFGKSHRYDAKESENFFSSSTIGEMHHFRQRVVNHITNSQTYNNFSHMLLLDVDIGVSISPLGVLHSLGHVQSNAIASSCRQPWPGGLGTLIPPYDFNAFESLQTKDTLWLKGLHQRFCAFMPPGDRWRFVCEAASPMKFLQIIQLDRANQYPYSVESAFNGAALYPLQLIRESNPKYDSGEDGQRCEHISFNRGLKKPMFVNPKWDMHMSPNKPGGPQGEQALRHFRRFGTLPQVAIPMFLLNFVPLSILVFSVMTLGVHCMKLLRHKFCKRQETKKWSKRDA